MFGSPVWPVPPLSCSSSLPDGRASSACSARPSGPFRRYPAPPRCQTGGHLLLVRPARLARSAAILLLLAARRAGIFCLPGPPVWPFPPLSCSSSMPDGRASSACSARPSGPFRRYPAPPRCQTGGHLLLARPARLARSAATLLLLAARRAGIFCLLGPPVWPVPPLSCSSSLPDGRASSACPARPSGPFRRYPAPPRCQRGGHLLLARPARLARSAAILLLLAARRAGIFCLPGPPVWPVPPLSCSSSLPDGRASSACSARPSGPFRRYPVPPRCQTGGHLLLARPARLARSAAILLLLAARRAGIFCLHGPPVWPVPPLSCSSSLPDGRASSACPDRPSGPFRRYPAPPRCQTGGHLLLARPARLARSAAILLLLAARRAGIFCLPGPPVWPVPPLSCSSSLPDGRASSACSARPSIPFRRYPAPPRCQTGGHLLLARPARLARSAAILLLLAARREGIFCLLDPPVWPVPPLSCSSSLPDGRASSACSARPSSPFRRYPAPPRCQTGGHLLLARPARLARSAAILLLLAARRAGIFCLLGPPVWPVPPLSCSSSMPDGRASSACSARPSSPFRRYPAPPRCQTGGHLLLARPARLARSAAILFLLAARRAGIFCLLGPPVWPVPPLSCSSSLPDGRASSACTARPSGSFRRYPAPPRCQTGGHLLLARPARLALSAAILLLLAARRAGIFCLLGPPVWPVPPLSCSSSLPDGRASSACPARPSGPFRRYPVPPRCQTGGHLLLARPARLARSAAILLLLAARRAGIFCLLGPPVWPVPPLSCFSSLPDGRASSACSARPSGPFRRYPVPPRCQTGGHLLLARPARLARSAAILLLLAARRAGIFCLLGPPVWPVPQLSCSFSLPDGRASSACPARPSGPFRRYPAPPRCQTGGHLLAAPPARLARSAAILLLLAARRAGIF